MYNDDEKAVIWLGQFDLVSNKKKFEILSLFEKPSKMLLEFDEKMPKISKIVGKVKFNQMLFLLTKENINKYVQNLDEMNIEIITYVSENYPQNFLEKDDFPIALYCKGDVELLKTDCFAIVGTRKPTAHGRVVTEKFATALSNQGFTIVSGIAYGVDAIAHESTLNARGKTIAVLGSGFNYFYPPNNRWLAQLIEEKGLLLTQYPPHVQSTQYTFPMRNRIIVMLSKGVLITEASLKSGSMHTRDFALDENIPLFAIPGNITNGECTGTNEIIKNYPGTCTLSPKDIIDEYKMKLKPAERVKVQLSIEEESVMQALREESTFDDIIEETGIFGSALSTILLDLQLKNMIVKVPGNKYAKKI